MYIINKYGVFTDIPDDVALPAGARKATANEVIEWSAKDEAGKVAWKQKKKEAAERRAQMVVNVGPAPEAAPIPPSAVTATVETVQTFIAPAASPAAQRAAETSVPSEPKGKPDGK